MQFSSRYARDSARTPAISAGRRLVGVGRAGRRLVGIGRSGVGRFAVAKPRTELLPWLSWPISIAIFSIPVLLLLVTIAVRALVVEPTMTVSVVDRFTGAAVIDARIVGEGVAVVTDADGRATVSMEAPLDVSVERPGYEPLAATLSADDARTGRLVLKPQGLTGTLTDAASGQPIVGVGVVLVVEDGSVAETKTAADGIYQFAEAPEGVRLLVQGGDYGRREEVVGERSRLDMALPLAVVSGSVRDASAAPLAGVMIASRDGAATTLSAADGTFRLVGVSAPVDLLVRAPGFGDQVLTAPAGAAVEVSLTAEAVRAVYANLGVLSDRVRLDRLIEIADTTEVNAIVIDVKQDTIYYETRVPFFREVPGMVQPFLDPTALVAELEAKGIYTIARMVVFKDPVVAEGRPDLAVRDEVSGGLWRDMNGAAWVNAFNEELWQANADLAVELAGFGFDEIQYDYIRFPSDGDLRTADFGPDYSEGGRRAAIKGAVALAGQQLKPTGAKFAIDLFPIVALFGDDQGIGQTLEDLVPLADVVCLMIYPSHYELGNIPVDGHPNDFPGETVTYTLERAEEMMPGSRAKMRPWLQDFTYPADGFTAYGPAEVRAQIDATENSGASGWLLWNAAGEFQVSALLPE